MTYDPRSRCFSRNSDCQRDRYGFCARGDDCPLRQWLKRTALDSRRRERRALKRKRR
jgi:hypothetical protein